MSNLTVTRGLSANILDTTKNPLSDGKMSIAKDTGALFVDNSGVRTPVMEPYATTAANITTSLTSGTIIFPNPPTTQTIYKIVQVPFTLGNVGSVLLTNTVTALIYCFNANGITQNQVSGTLSGTTFTITSLIHTSITAALSAANNFIAQNSFSGGLISTGATTLSSVLVTGNSTFTGASNTFNGATTFNAPITSGYPINLTSNSNLISGANRL